MVKAKRARKAETLKQPSLCLRLRAPYFYPDIHKSGSERGVKFFYKAEYCGTPQSKERRNGEYKVCLNNRALRLLDQDVSVPQQVTLEMGVGLPQPACRSRLQTAIGGFG
jgi:hypothetical protein